MINLQQALLGPPSCVQNQNLTNWVGTDPLRFAELLDAFFSADYRLCQRASAVVNTCVETHPWLINPYLEKLLVNVRRPDCPNAVQRNIFRLLQFVALPKVLHDLAVDVYFDYLDRSNVPVANRIFAMTALSRLVVGYPELARELRHWIEDRMPMRIAGFSGTGPETTPGSTPRLIGPGPVPARHPCGCGAKKKWNFPTERRPTERRPELFAR